MIELLHITDTHLIEPGKILYDLVQAVLRRPEGDFLFLDTLDEGADPQRFAQAIEGRRTLVKAGERYEYAP